MRLNKKDYIAKYGEEAWVKESEKRQIRKTRWRNNNPDYNHSYYEANKEKMKQQHRDYYKENRGTILDQAKDYARKNKEKIQTKSKQYYADNSEKIKQYQKDRRLTMDGLARIRTQDYRKLDRIHNRDGFNLTPDWIIENIFNSSCIYCGETDWHLLGCDRIDNTQAHTTDNCVCACGKCNREKGKVLSVEEFKAKKQRKLNPNARV